MPSPDVMVGTWKLVRQENFDEYIHAVGAGLMTRSMSDPETWCCVIEKLEEDVFKMTVKTTVKSQQCVFRLDGREIEEVTGDGRRCRSVIVWDSEKGILTQKRIGLDGCKGGMLARIFKGDEMELLLQVDDVIARRIYQRESKEPMDL